MDLKSVINIILGDLKEAADLMDELKNKPEYPELRAELAKSKCRSAGDMIRIIGDILEDIKTEDPGSVSDNHREDKESTRIETAEKESVANEPTKKEEETAAESWEVFESTADNKPLESNDQKDDHEMKDFTEQKEGTGQKDLTEQKEDVGQKDLPEQKEDADRGTEKGKEKKADKIIADRFAHLSSRMNEKVGDSKKGGGKIRTIPVTDLNRALGVNDRFYFTRELFNGNADLFRETIDKLNRASSTAEAQDIMNRELADLADTEAALQLFELVERKLSVK